MVRHSLGLAKCLLPFIGYKEGTKVAQLATKQSRVLAEALVSEGMCTKDVLDKFMPRRRLSAPSSWQADESMIQQHGARGRLQMVRYLHADANAAAERPNTAYGNTLRHGAAVHGHLEMARYLHANAIADADKRCAPASSRAGPIQTSQG